MKYFDLGNQGVLVELHGRRPVFRLIEFDFHEDLNHQLDLFQSLLYMNYFKIFDFDVEFVLTDEGIIRISSAISKKFRIKITRGGICIDDIKLDVHYDGSGSMVKFVGKKEGDWWTKFVNDINIHSKHRGQPKTYLKYSLNGLKLKATNDCRREYEPEGKERWSYDVVKVMFLLEYKLKKILHSIGMKSPMKNLARVPYVEELFNEPDPVMLTNELFANKVFVAYANEPARIKPNMRVLSLGQKLDHPLEDEMHEGFIYMDIFDKDEVSSETKRRNVKEFMVEWQHEQKPFAILPRTYDKLFVMDMGADNPAATFCKINEYTGGFSEPILVCNRTLTENEIIPL